MPQLILADGDQSPGQLALRRAKRERTVWMAVTIAIVGSLAPAMSPFIELTLLGWMMLAAWAGFTWGVMGSRQKALPPADDTGKVGLADDSRQP